MDTYEFGELLKELKIKLQNIEKIIKPNEAKEKLEEIQKMQEDPNLWQDTKKAAMLGKEKTKLNNLLSAYENAKSELVGTIELFELAMKENDTDTLEALFAESDNLNEVITTLEISMLLSGENDNKGAIVNIHPGAGGTESNDWASIVYRMYLRFCEREGYKVETLDFQEGDEAGIKDVSFIVRGDFAYGYFKAEHGVHRLVRISPFDSNARRHTSFCSVIVSPEIDDDIEIQVEEKDIRIDYYRASGAGGQHVNKTESAVRITHLPTNIVVQCQNDRSQHKNKATAMKMLKSRLYELELEKQNENKDTGAVGENSFGHQIRSYVLAPYQQVKDLRSNIAYSQVDSILDGDIKKLIEGVLIANK
ncbi:peptide chain release factor 2 [Campylobacter canadensis]|uniref:Peptide chain release factor 2 n=1 Tax=Campylobacter canadensis TaxID=449520 RepID=A0ABS7WPA3_9BACT|nr:peptide chain release factor 2 [Campylobacter canadensis]MBZ7986591.1 peptide chain release factor 2 [Campylobacter canadensis]MBZ7994004.1 peptide chain release factor 2 [Campylobacter canadensis]MBZ7995993.1 peptide chain release factor 2 [Campylobacter canadensis]MBZ7997627.1 peptide chain release factor 2 [Campylobacter canadensis]MBZ7999335.1 peptide chain release factor 2 [Campylobacter canadensis]